MQHAWSLRGYLQLASRSHFLHCKWINDICPSSCMKTVNPRRDRNTCFRFTKTYRVNQIMKHAARFRRVKITATDVMKPMVALLFVNIVILTVFTAVDPLHHETVVVIQDPFSRDLETYGKS
jgi:hypothetical protein